jgi:hypothetical protein
MSEKIDKLPLKPKDMPVEDYIEKILHPWLERFYDAMQKS